MKSSLTPAEQAEWNLVLRDLRPSAILRTVERRKPAVHAAWMARAVDDAALTEYANVWREAGWSAAEWWRLSICVRALTSGTHRELGVQLLPERFESWRELADKHGALITTVAFLDDYELPLETRLHWAAAERKLTRPGIGRPGQPIA